MGVLGRIFGTEKAIDSGIRAIDALVFTDEEKSKLKLEFMKHAEPFKLAQRVLAFMFSSVFLYVYLVSVHIWLYGAVFETNLDRSGYLMAIAFELAEWNTIALGSSIAIILGFYFLGGVVNGIPKKG